MSSEFESSVYIRENHTPWASISVARFMKDMAWNGNCDKEVILSVRHRASVSSRLWWTISWVAEDGERHEQSAQTLDKALWRASELELRIREKVERERQAKQTVISSETRNDPLNQELPQGMKE